MITPKIDWSLEEMEAHIDVVFEAFDTVGLRLSYMTGLLIAAVKDRVDDPVVRHIALRMEEAIDEFTASKGS